LKYLDPTGFDGATTPMATADILHVQLLGLKLKKKWQFTAMNFVYVLLYMQIEPIIQ